MAIAHAVYMAALDQRVAYVMMCIEFQINYID